MEHDGVSLASEGSRTGLGTRFRTLDAENIDPEVVTESWVAESELQTNLLTSIIVRALILKQLRSLKSMISMVQKQRKAQQSPDQIMAEIEQLRWHISAGKKKVEALKDELLMEKSKVVERTNHLEDEVHKLWSFSENLGAMRFTSDYEYEKAVGELNLNLKMENELHKCLSERLKTAKAEEYLLNKVLAESMD